MYLALNIDCQDCTRYLLSMDEDLDGKSQEELKAEIIKLRRGIREHRDSSRHELCWFHPKIWALVPEKLEIRVSVPEWSQFLKGCIKYRESLDQQLPDAPRTDGEY